MIGQTISHYRIIDFCVEGSATVSELRGLRTHRDLFTIAHG